MVVRNTHDQAAFPLHQPSHTAWIFHFTPDLLCIQALEHHARIGAAKAERVRQDAAELRVIDPLPHNRHVCKRRIEPLDMGALADETIVHHEDRVDGLLRAGGSE